MKPSAEISFIKYFGIKNSNRDVQTNTGSENVHERLSARAHTCVHAVLILSESDFTRKLTVSFNIKFPKNILAYYKKIWIKNKVLIPDCILPNILLLYIYG